MNAKAALLAAVTGFAGFMVTTVAVTALLEPRIEFSVLVGLPAGVLVGLVSIWFVYTRLTRRAPGSTGQRASIALVAAAVGFIVVMALGVTFGGGAMGSLVLAVGIAFGIGIVMYLRGPETI